MGLSISVFTGAFVASLLLPLGKVTTMIPVSRPWRRGPLSWRPIRIGSRVGGRTLSPSLGLEVETMEEVLLLGMALLGEAEL